MCVLIVCRFPDEPFPILLGANREEDPARLAHPPGLHVVDGVRTLCPQDRRHGGTWVGFNEHGVFAALTNLASAESDPKARSRGGVPFAALSTRNAEEALAAVVAHCKQGPLRPFQLLVGDAERVAWLRYADERIDRQFCDDEIVVMTNRHEFRQVEVPGLAAWHREQRATAAAADAVDSRLDHLLVVLATGHGIATDGSRFEICIETGMPRTVSATLAALPREGVAGARMRYCPGSPRLVASRDYSGLVRRLSEPLHEG